MLLGELKDKPPWHDFPLEPLSEAWISEGFQDYPLIKAESGRDAFKRRRNGVSNHHPNGGFANRFGEFIPTRYIFKTMWTRRRVFNGGRQNGSSSEV